MTESSVGTLKKESEALAKYVGVGQTIAGVKVAIMNDLWGGDEKPLVFEDWQLKRRIETLKQRGIEADESGRALEHLKLLVEGRRGATHSQEQIQKIL